MRVRGRCEGGVRAVRGRCEGGTRVVRGHRETLIYRKGMVVSKTGVKRAGQVQHSHSARRRLHSRRRPWVAVVLHRRRWWVSGCMEFQSPQNRRKTEGTNQKNRGKTYSDSLMPNSAGMGVGRVRIAAQYDHSIITSSPKYRTI